MIFIYQIRTLKHQIVACHDLTCPLCGARGGVEIGIYQKYTWLFMPMWPRNKYGMASCAHCQQPIAGVKWTDELEHRYYQLKKETRTPLGLWRGLFINPLLFLTFLGIITGIVFILAKVYKQKRVDDKVLIAACIDAPQTGDLYRTMIYENGPNPMFNYTYLRYSSISGDTLFVERLKKSTTVSGDWDKLDTKESNAFDAEKIPLSFSFFKQSQDFKILGKETVHLFFKGIDRGDKTLSKD